MSDAQFVVKAQDNVVVLSVVIGDTEQEYRIDPDYADQFSSRLRRAAEISRTWDVNRPTTFVRGA